MILHTINKSPFSDASLASCLRVALPGDILLFIEDGVYATLNDHPLAVELKKLSGQCEIWALQPDIDARGLAGKTTAYIKTTDYPGFVTLTERCAKVLSWY